jgi:hypothetical protein
MGQRRARACHHGQANHQSLAQAQGGGLCARGCMVGHLVAPYAAGAMRHTNSPRSAYAKQIQGPLFLYALNSG